MNEIIYEDNHLLVVYKKINVPVQKDESNDLDLLTILKRYLKEKYNKPGNVYLGLVHRLDRPVSGIMVFAKTSKAASRLSEQIRNKSFKKTYLAVVEGTLPRIGVLEDKIYKDHTKNQVYISNKGKFSSLDYKLIEKKDNLNLVKINLHTGRSHQIRIQFASRNNPLYGDQKYNKNAKVGEQIALFASSIEFVHPTTKEKLFFELPKPNKYPFSIFE